MARSHGSVGPRRRRGIFGEVLLAVILLGLVAAAPALAKTGRVGPEAGKAWDPGALAARLAQGSHTTYGIWDAQRTGAIVYARTDTAQGTTLTATDATGKTVWSAAGGDFWGASGTLPAALIASFTDPDPNVLRDGELRAYDAGGHVTFHKTLTRTFVQPLADTARRLVWVEVSAQAVTRVFVRQGSTTRSVAVPYRARKASLPDAAASSADGSRVVVGTFMPSTSRRRVMTYWLQVSPSGVPHIVSSGITDWVGASLTPNGDKAAILTSDGLGDGPNWWVSFGKFHGRMLPGNDAGMLDASARLIFEQGAYTYSSDTVAWGATTVEVFDRSLTAIYKRTWTFDDDSSSIWFRHDSRIDRLAGVDNKGALTAINVGSWAITTVPGTYADAVPVAGGRLATMTPDGTLAYIDDPVAGP